MPKRRADTRRATPEEAQICFEELSAHRTTFVLDDAAWRAFVERLDQPARVIPQVRELFARPRP